MLYPHLAVNEQHHLTIGGLDTLSIAREYGTPCYVLDENVIRSRCRVYREACAEAFGPKALPLFASKALCFTGMYKIIAEEGLGIDCVSGGELYTAAKAGFPSDHIYFHGNNKTDADLKQAVGMHVGTIVVDGFDELEALETICAAAGTRQRILLRIAPGIDPHTFRAVRTGSVDSKFGTAIQTGQALEIVRKALSLPHIDLAGCHCHIGSQIFETQPFRDAAAIMVAFLVQIRKDCGVTLSELNLGGGPGVPYTQDDPSIDYRSFVTELGVIVRSVCESENFPVPSVRIEPGRSIVADAGLTLYTVGGVKEIPGFKNYISVDGGMPDNPRYALYQSRYTALIADRADEPKTYTATLAGRCCESGDLIGENMPIQKARRGDILAVLCTGAYNYSMASHYNRLPNPPVVLVRDGKTRLGVRRETYADLTALDQEI